MKLLVHASSLANAPRMLAAAWGLSLRGHEVLWWGDALPAGASADSHGAPRFVVHARDASRPDVMLGGAHDVVRVAASAGLASAHAVILDAPAGIIEHWHFLERAAWGTLVGLGFVDAPAEAGGVAQLPGFEAEAVVAWSGLPLEESPEVTSADTELLERACERLAAAQRGLGARPALFLDRDGTLVVEVGYLANPDDIELLPGVAAALRTLHAAGYTLVVVSNQSGVGRGLFPHSRVYEAMAELRRKLRAEGVELDAIYFCPHRPDAGCACRKPGTLLLERASRNLRLSLRESMMVGDKRLDAETGRRAGAQGMLVRTGYGRDEEQRDADDSGWPRPAHVANDLAAAVPWLVEALG